MLTKGRGSRENGEHCLSTIAASPSDMAEPRAKTPTTPDGETDEAGCTSLKECIAKFGDGTTFHGVRFVTDYKLHFLRRLLWVCIVAGMTGYLLYGISVSVLTYFQRPVTSVVKINYVREIPFPAVTFCNYNQWKKSRVAPDFHDVVRSLNPTNTAPLDVDYLKTHDLMNLTDRLINDTHRIADMLMECTFKAVNCSSRNFTRIITDFGLCYSFNNNPHNVYHIHQSGSHNALYMKINVEQQEYISGENNAAGVKLLVHPPGQRPLVKELGIAVSPGFQTLVGIQLKQVLNLKAPYESNCTDGNLRFSNKYTVPLCQYEHRIDDIQATCGCRDMRHPEDDDVDECPLSKYYTCLQPTEASLTASDMSFNCQVPCNLTIYETHVSFSYYPGQHHLHDVTQATNLTESDIRKNVLDVRIYFEELSYQKIEEIPSYEFSNLQSSIGGYMGLLIGASIITAFEFLDFILVTMVTHLTRNREVTRLKKNRVRGVAKKTPNCIHK